MKKKLKAVGFKENAFYVSKAFLSYMVIIQLQVHRFPLVHVLESVWIRLNSLIFYFVHRGKRDIIRLGPNKEC